MSERASTWSITINNPEPHEYENRVDLPSGWILEGQLERGEKGTEHFQGMLKTPQVRFSAVKRAFPRAHIEPARNRQALEQYVHKPDSRVATVETSVSQIPNLFNYQQMIASKWNNMEWEQFVLDNQDLYDKKPNEVVLMYVDSLVSTDIRSGRRGVEYIAINPMWRQAWKLFGKAIVYREINFPLQSISDGGSKAEEVLLESTDGKGFSMEGETRSLGSCEEDGSSTDDGA
jgi:hypothetical protein